MNKKIKIAVIGLGYVGLPLHINLSKYFNTIGYDLSSKRIKDLKRGIDLNEHVSPNMLKRLSFTNNLNLISGCNTFIVTVPTPIKKNNIPDLISLEKANNMLSSILKKNDLVIYESTVYPGTIEEICIKTIEKKTSFEINKDFEVGYSPERINPGDKINNLQNITKIISGTSKKANKKIYYIYSKFIKKIHLVHQIRSAEMAKLMENCQRDINIALFNEFYLITEKLGINYNEAVNAASTKWNFNKYTPGLVGGHCIGVDPFYLAYQSKKNGYNPKLILSGRLINDSMPKFYIKKILNKIKNLQIKKNQIKILILGASFKENVKDIRNSKTVDLYKLLIRNNIKTYIYDNIIDINEFNSIYGIKVYTKIPKFKFDFFIISSPHNTIMEFKNKDYAKYGTKNYYIIDIKKILNANIIKNII